MAEIELEKALKEELDKTLGSFVAEFYSNSSLRKRGRSLKKAFIEPIPAWRAD